MLAITNQAKIDYLQQYSILILEKKRTIAEVSRWNDLYNQTISFLTDSTVKKLKDMVRYLYQRADYLQAIHARIGASIAVVEDDHYRELLTLRYIDGLTFEEIAVKMSYCQRYIFRLHKKALAQVEIN